MSPKTIATVVDFGIFFLLLFALDWSFLPALVVSVLAGVVVEKLLSDNGFGPQTRLKPGVCCGAPVRLFNLLSERGTIPDKLPEPMDRAIDPRRGRRLDNPR